MNPKWAWLGYALTVLMVFAAPTATLAAIIPVKVTLIASLAVGVVTAVIATVNGFANKTATIAGTILLFIGVFAGPGWANVLGSGVENFLTVLAEVITAVTTFTPTARAKAAAKYALAQRG